MSQRSTRSALRLIVLLLSCDPPPIEDAGGADAGFGGIDAGAADSGSTHDAGDDAGSGDAGLVDAGVTDAGSHDTGSPDAGVPDAAVADGGAFDAGRADAGLDAGAPDAGGLKQGAYLYDYDNVVIDLTARATTLTWLRNNGYTDVYLSCERYFGNNTLSQLAGFVQDAKTNYSLNTTLLFSDYAWSLDVNHAAARAEIQAAVTWLHGLPPGQVRPVAIQIDVEPHALSGWDTSNQATIQDLGSQYLRLLDTINPIMNGVPLQAVIAYHYDNRTVTRTTDAGTVSRPFSEWVIDSSSSTLMMNYRDVGSKLESGARSEIVYASSVNKKVYVAVKAKQNVTVAADGGITVSADQTDNFSDEGSAAMRTALNIMETTPFHRDGTTGALTPDVPLNTLRGYGGWSIFAYTYIRQLGP